MSYNQSADALESGRDEDILDGTKGHDVLIGGAGDGILTGGEGRDTFIWKAGETGNDVIRDFTLGEEGDVYWREWT